MTFKEWVNLAGLAMEGAGVFAMVAGAVVALVMSLVRRGQKLAGAYHRFRIDLGRAILLGLELLVAADIIRTVGEEPTMRGVLVLGVIVLIRTFLSFTLSVELEGHWPWQRGPKAPGTKLQPPSESLHGASSSPPARDRHDAEHPAPH